MQAGALACGEAAAVGRVPPRARGHRALRVGPLKRNSPARPPLVLIGGTALRLRHLRPRRGQRRRRLLPHSRHDASVQKRREILTLPGLLPETILDVWPSAWLF